MFGNIPDESDRLKRQSTWLDMVLFKSLRISVAILFGPSIPWLFRETFSLESPLQAVGEIKNESQIVGRRKSKNRFFFLNM